MDHPPDTTLPEGEALDAEIGQDRGNHGNPGGDPGDRVAARIAALQEEDIRTQSIAHEVEAMERMYCPCAGFMYNSLGGERNVLVSDSPLLIRRCPDVIFHSPYRCSANESVQTPPCSLPCAQAGKRGQGGRAAARGRRATGAGRVTRGRRGP
jgi:hypothetical protein